MLYYILGFISGAVVLLIYDTFFYSNYEKEQEAKKRNDNS